MKTVRETATENRKWAVETAIKILNETSKYVKSEGPVCHLDYNSPKVVEVAKELEAYLE